MSKGAKETGSDEPRSPPAGWPLRCHCGRLGESTGWGFSASLRTARVRDAAGGGLRAREAARDGLVTITDHDTIAGCLEIAGRDDVFISGELHRLVPRRAAGDPRALLPGSPRDDHEWLQEHALDLEACAHDTTHSLRDRLLSGARVPRGREAPR